MTGLSRPWASPTIPEGAKESLCKVSYKAEIARTAAYPKGNNQTMRSFSTASSFFSSILFQAMKMAAPERAHMTGTAVSRALGFSTAPAISMTRAALDVLDDELKREKAGIRLPAKAGVIGRRLGRKKRAAMATVLGW